MTTEQDGREPQGNIQNSADQSEGLRGRAAHSAALSVAARLIGKLLGIASLLVLARMLSPEDFGIIAVVLLIAHFIDVIANCGTMQYVMQSKLMDEARLGSAWSLDVLLKTAVLVCLYTMLPILAGYWEDPVIALAIAVHAPTILIRVLWNPRLHVDRRELKYQRIIKLQLISKFFSFVVAIVLAIVTRSFWAIIVADLAGALLACVLSHMLWPRAPKPQLGHVHEQWAFSGWMLGRGLLGYAKAQLDVLVVASAYPLAALGRYNLAREITVMPAEEVIKPAMEPLVSMFSRLRDDRTALAVEVESALLILVAVITPLVLFLLGFAGPTVVLLLGPNWSGLERVIIALVPLLPTYAFGHLLVTLLISTGRVRLLFAYDLISLGAVASLLFWTAGVSLELFASARAALGVVLTLPMLEWTLRVTGTSLRRNATRLAVPIVLCIFALWLARLVLGAFAMLPATVGFLVATSVFLSFYTITLFFFSARFASTHSGWNAITTGIKKAASLSRPG